MTEPGDASVRAWLPAFLVVSLAWGSSFLFIAIALRAFSPVQVGFGRVAIGAVVLVVMVAFANQWPRLTWRKVGAALMLGATACYGIGGTLSRVLLSRVQDSNLTLAAMQIALSALMLAPFVLASPRPLPATFELGSQALWALIALGVLGTSFAYVLFWRVVKVAGATTAASVTYVVPVVATFLGVVVLGAELPWYQLVGAGIVFAGVAIAGRKKKPVTLVDDGPASQDAITGPSEVAELAELEAGHTPEGANES